MEEIIEKKPLKSFTLPGKFNVLYNGKVIDSFYDYLSAALVLYFLNGEGWKTKLGNKTVYQIKELRVIYGETDHLKKIIQEFQATERFKKNSTNGMVLLNKNPKDLNSSKVLMKYDEFAERCRELSKKYMKGRIETADELNKQLEEVLNYGLFDDQSFSNMTDYYFKLIFNKTTSRKDISQVGLDDGKILELSVDDGDNIPDWLIEYSEDKYGEFFGRDREKEGIGFGAFCKNLRDVIGFVPGDRQRYALVAQKRFTYVVCSRKYGKSYWMAYLAIRQLFLKEQDIVYVVPDFTMADQVYFYLERFIRDTGDSSLRFDKARRQISYTDTRSNLIFVSGESKYVGRSRKANLLLYDEASFLADIVENTLRPLISNTMGYQVAVSTPSPTTPINRFYFGFKKGELGNNADQVLSIRRDLYHNKWIPDEEKKNLIDHYKNDPILSQSELLAMFPINAGAFNLADFFMHWPDYKEFTINGIKIKFKNDVEELKKEYSQFVMGYDPALLKDKGGFVLIGVKSIIEIDKGLKYKRNSFEIVGGAYINIKDYTHQIDFLKTIQDTVMDYNHPCHCAMDYTGAGMGVYELMIARGIMNVHRIMWTGNQKGEPVFDNGFWKASKQDLESMFRTNMGSLIYAYNFLDELRGEIEVYGTAARSAGDAHFDQLSATFVAFFICKRYIGEYTGEKNNMIVSPEDLILGVKDMIKGDPFEPSGILFGKGKGLNPAASRSKNFIY